ncbi:MAG: WYL domain-containing protein [Victivallaceae bacterium]|nr:WYL domain-containing protein [Victivallaceae bacterium]
MPLNKKQIFRLQKFVGQLKENRYPNCRSFSAELHRVDCDYNRNIACSAKTIQRDIQLLRNEFGCPLAFDFERNGYYLKHHGWNFDIPLLQEEHEMMAAVLGARVAENIFPEPLRGNIRQAVDTLLANVNPDFLDKAFIKSLTIIPGLKVSIDPDIFMTIYQAWQEHEAIQINYLDVNGNSTSRLIEPHALVYYECAWYIKGFCLLRQEIRNFAMHRIVEAEHGNKYFEPDQQIIDSLLNDHFLEYLEVSDIQVRCANSIRGYVLSNPLHRCQTFTPDGPNYFLLHIPAMPEHELIQWVLYQGGNVELRHPVELCSKIADAAEKILEKHTK